jgi:hypothetical protein
MLWLKRLFHLKGGHTEERNLFEELDEIEQAVGSLAQKQQDLLNGQDRVISLLEEILTLLNPPAVAAKLVLTLGKPISQ